MNILRCLSLLKVKHGKFVENLLSKAVVLKTEFQIKFFRISIFVYSTMTLFLFLMFPIYDNDLNRLILDIL
jgi:hypothetical protein